MNFEDFFERIKTIERELERQERDLQDVKVCITLAGLYIGMREYTEIHSIYMGKGWEEGQVRIDLKDDVVFLGGTLEDAVRPKREIKDGIEILYCRRCNQRVYITDNYCSRCGQKIG